jgi:hypothetical protein
VPPHQACHTSKEKQWPTIESGCSRQLLRLL